MAVAAASSNASAETAETVMAAVAAACELSCNDLLVSFAPAAGAARRLAGALLVRRAGLRCADAAAAIGITVAACRDGVVLVDHVLAREAWPLRGDIDALAEALAAALSDDLAARWLRGVRIAAVAEAVALAAGITLVDLKARRRTRCVAVPRGVAMALCTRLTAASLPEIGRWFGDRDHTTVMHQRDRYDAVLSRIEPDAVAAGQMDLATVARAALAAAAALPTRYRAPCRRLRIVGGAA